MWWIIDDAIQPGRGRDAAAEMAGLLAALIL